MAFVVSIVSRAVLRRTYFTVICRTPSLSRVLKDVLPKPIAYRYPCSRLCSTHSSNEGSDESTKEASSSGTYEEAPKETLPSADSAADLLQDVVEEQQLNSAEQQLNSEEQQLNAEEQQLNAEEQQLKDENISTTQDLTFEPDSETREEKWSSLLNEEDMKSLNVDNRSWDPRDVLENDRTAEELQRFRSQRVDTRQYLKELEKLPIMHIRCTQNNTYIDICDHTGNILTWKSAGSIGYKNSRRGTTFAAQSTGHAAALKAKEFGIKRVRVKLKGIGMGRQHALKGFQLGGLEIMSLQDVTPVPHNGCRPKKKRRV